MAVPQRKVGSTKAGNDAVAEAQADAARRKGISLSVTGRATTMEKAFYSPERTTLSGKSCVES